MFGSTWLPPRRRHDVPISLIRRSIAVPVLIAAPAAAMGQSARDSAARSARMQAAMAAPRQVTALAALSSLGNPAPSCSAKPMMIDRRR